jgi:hypothetical protein
MDDTKKMLRTIISGQSLLKSELLGEINKLRNETNKGFENLNKRMQEGFKKVNQRVSRLEHKTASA